MVSAYTAFPNKGIRSAPLFVTRIEDSDGNIVGEFFPRMNEVIDDKSAAKMIVLMRGVVDSGTGARMRRLGISAPMGGKTGTTNNNSDAWFMGVTPRLVSGCWVGGDDRDIHFDSMTIGQGAAMALPVFAYYMKRVYNDSRLGYNENAMFDIPEGYNPCAYEESGLKDVEGGEDIEEVFE
jgi:penicillin-binding protein 1A